MDNEYRQHQLMSMELFSHVKPRDVITVNSRVKVQKLRSVFRKFQPLHSPLWSEEIYTVTKIDKQKFPFVYEVTGLKKKFYAFQLLKVSEYYPLERKNSLETRILVQKCVVPSRFTLRSGRKTVLNDENVIYTILKDNVVSTVDKEELIRFKRSLGNDVLVYSPFFSKPANLKFIV